jgi:RNA polymerase sigma-70 factor, ECF subfamily
MMPLARLPHVEAVQWRDRLALPLPVPRSAGQDAPPLGAWLLKVMSLDGDTPASSTDGRRDGLVRRAAAGDPDAFESLMRGVGNRLLVTARKILRDGDAAEDAVQQTVIMAWRLLPRLRDPARLDGWLYKLLVSACYQEARRARRHTRRVEIRAAEPAADDDAERWLAHEALEQAFRTLTPAHRAVVVLHHYAGLPLTDVAAVVGISPGTARSRLHYALRALRAALEAADRPVVVDLDR